MSLTEMKLECNSKIRIDFGGGNLSSDGGLLLMNEFLSKIGFERLVAAKFKTSDDAKRFHSDVDNLMQVMYQIFSSYNEDDCADELSNEPVITAVLEKDRLASQPTLSRFYNRMDETTLQQFSDILVELRKIVYRINPPKQVLFDLDSTLLRLFGNQEGKGYNVHYAAVGYHPLLCYDGLNGDLLKAELRSGTQYCGKEAAAFMQSLFDEFNNNYYQTHLFLRGDSGFAMPDLFDACEDNCCKYAIRLKENPTLRKLAVELDEILFDRAKDNAIDYAEAFGEFDYQASSWRQPRRVVVKIEKPYGQMDHQYTFVVTNMDLPIRDVVRFYCNRGAMENFIKEGKNGFDFGAVSSSSMIVNSNRFQIHCLAYNLFNWFRRMVLPKSMRKMQVDTIRLRLIKIAARVAHKARQLWFRLCSHCPYKDEFRITLENIQALQV